MIQELKACPFCGGKASGKAWSNPSGEFGPGCTDCGVTAESSVAWNTRILPQPAGVEVVEVVAYALEHPEAGYKVYKQFSQWMVDGEWECRPLMTVAQHNRIVDAAKPPDSRVVPVELLRDLLDEGPRAATWAAQEKIRAFLEVKDE